MFSTCCCVKTISRTVNSVTRFFCRSILFRSFCNLYRNYRKLYHFVLERGKQQPPPHVLLLNVAVVRSFVRSFVRPILQHTIHHICLGVSHSFSSASVPSSLSFSLNFSTKPILGIYIIHTSFCFSLYIWFLKSSF